MAFLIRKIGNPSGGGPPPPPCTDFDAGLYSYAQLDDLITNQGYIPVANSAELDEIRTVSGTPVEMGLGTCWEADYIIATDSKYVQVRNLDLTLLTHTTPISFINNSIYDGNELQFNNLTSTATSIFGSTTGNLHTLKNLSISGYSRSGAGNNVGTLVGRSFGGTYSNNTISGSVSGGLNTGGMIGRISGIATLTDCHFSGTVTGTASQVGGVTGLTGVDVTITDCTTSGTITATTTYAGGICGYSIDTNYSGCSSSADVIGTDLVAGIVSRLEANNTINTCTFTGTTSASAAGGRTGGISALSDIDATTISECTVDGATISGAPSNSSSGIAGILAISSFAGNTIDRCKVLNTTVQDTGTGFFTGGILARDLTATTITDCYVDNNSTIAGVQRVGGLGGNIGNAGSFVTDCYSAAVVTGGAFTGGLIGQGGTATITASYWDTVTSGQAASAGGTASTTTEMKADVIGAAGIYLNWSGAVWTSGTVGVDYPSLI